MVSPTVSMFFPSVSVVFMVQVRQAAAEDMVVTKIAEISPTAAGTRPDRPVYAKAAALFFRLDERLEKHPRNINYFLSVLKNHDVR